MALTVDQAKEYILKQIKDFRAPDKKGFETVKNWGEQQKREYADAREDAARTGTPEDLARAKRLQEIVKLYEDVVKSRDLTTKAQTLYENISANRKKIESLRGLGEGRTEEAKKIQRQLTRARAELQAIEKERNAFGTVKKEDQTTPQKIVEKKVAEEEVAPPPPKVPGDIKGDAGKGKGKGKGSGKTPPPVTDEEQRIKALDVAATDFSLPETIFKNVPSLNKILQRYVDEDWTEEKLRKAILDGSLALSLA